MVERYIPKKAPKARGRGRPRGRRNTLNSEQRRAAALTGELPHQFMLRVMRLGAGEKVGRHLIDWDDVKWAAKNAAPYYAARLASLHIKPDGKPAVVIQLDPDKLKDMSANDLSRMLAALLQANTPTIAGELASRNPDEDIEDIDPDLYEATLS